MGIRIFTVFISIWSVLLWILSGLIHIWTVYIAYSHSGVFFGLVTLFFPFISQIIWGFVAWNNYGFESSYIQWLCIVAVMWIIQFVLGYVASKIDESESRRYYLNENYEPAIDDKPVYFGFGGWLYFLAVGQILIFGRSLFYLIDSLLPLYSSGQVQTISQENPMLAFGIFFESVINVYNVIIILISAFLCYKMKKSFKRLMIYFFSINLSLAIVYYLLVHMIPNVDSSFIIEQRNVLINAAIVFILWVPYFIKSKRVNNTFVL